MGGRGFDPRQRHFSVVVFYRDGVNSSLDECSYGGHLCYCVGDYGIDLFLRAILITDTNVCGGASS